jgi:NAD-dependent SIR2 family protein deacetylase
MRYRYSCAKCGWEVPEDDVVWNDDAPPLGFCEACWEEKLVEKKEWFGEELDINGNVKEEVVNED